MEQSTGILRDIGVDNPGPFLSSLLRSAVDNAITTASAPTAIDLSEVFDEPQSDDRGWYLRGE